MAGLSPIGNDWDEMRARLLAKSSGIRYLPEWEKYNGLLTRLGAPVENFSLRHYTRKIPAAWDGCRCWRLAPRNLLSPTPVCSAIL
jgi:hypothetical protein